MNLLILISLSIVVGMLATHLNWSKTRLFLVCLVLGILVGALEVVSSFAKEPPYIKLRATTVHIAIGTGSIVESKSGQVYLLTNWHVCNSGSWKGKMRANYEGGELVEGTIVKVSQRADLCAARVSKDRPTLRISKFLKKNQRLYTRGYPFGVLSETSGEWVGYHYEPHTYPIEEVGECFTGSRKLYDMSNRLYGCSVPHEDNIISVYTRPGSSGSPVVDSDGNLVGVISSWYGYKDIGGMVTFENLVEFMKGL